jgi:transposase-like protein
VALRDHQTLYFLLFQTSPEIVRLAVMLCIRIPPSWRNVEELLHERGIEINNEIGKHTRAAGLPDWRGLLAA